MNENENVKIKDVIDCLYSERIEIKDNNLKALELFISYCNNYYSDKKINQINKGLFEKFMIYYLPKSRTNINKKNFKQGFNSISLLLESINKEYNYDSTKEFKECYKKYGDETLRILDLRKEIFRYSTTPIISINPLVIDFSYYKDGINNKKWSHKREIYEQGYFENVDHIGGYYYLFKKINAKSCYVKIKFENGTAGLLKDNDIINMRLKRKLFSTNWEIIEIKECYLNQVNKYIK